MPINPTKCWPTLYKRNKDRSIQEWRIFAGEGQYFTVSGKVNGKMVVHAPVAAKPKNVGKKNATTADQQAEKEAQAKWDTQCNEGYTSNINLIDSCLEGVLFPMLAENFEDHGDKLLYPVYAQPKLDGLRSIHLPNDSRSRYWKPFVTVAHIREVLAPLFAAHPTVRALDGELYSHEHRNDFNEIVSLVKQPKATPEDIEKIKASPIQLYIYDFIPAKSIPMPFEDRNIIMREMEKECQHKYIHWVETTLVNSREELDAVYKRHQEQGYEGTMIRMPKSRYVLQFRTTNLLKRKEEGWIDTEFEIVGFKDGTGSHKGWPTLKVKVPKEKNGIAEVVSESPLTGEEPYQKAVMAMLESGELIGKFATIQFQNYTPKGFLRFPTGLKFRDAEGEEIPIPVPKQAAAVKAVTKVKKAAKAKVAKAAKPAAQ